MKTFRLFLADQFLHAADLEFAAHLWWRLAVGLWAVGGALGVGVMISWWMRS